MMKTLLFLGLSLFVVLAVPTTGKVFDRCELAKLLHENSFENFQGYKVADWICLADHESGLKTTAVHDYGSSRDYGIFQISSRYWCDDGITPGSKNGCKISCNELLDDDIDVDIQCAKKIARKAKGLTPWRGWKNNCRKNVDGYVKDCFKNASSN